MSLGYCSSLLCGTILCSGWYGEARGAGVVPRRLAHLSVARGAWPARAQPRARTTDACAQTSGEMPPILINSKFGPAVALNDTNARRTPDACVMTTEITPRPPTYLYLNLPRALFPLPSVISSNFRSFPSIRVEGLARTWRALMFPQLR